jgi:hypothetical protein
LATKEKPLRGAPKIVAAALTSAAIAGFVLSTLASGAASGSRAVALVTLQVAPRGPGSISASPAGLDDSNQTVTSPCDQNNGQESCTWRYPQGTAVKLTSSPVGGASFTGWSSPECQGTGSCSVTLDSEVTSIVALFNPLKLGVVLSVDDSGVHGRVTSSPTGISCHQENCPFGKFAPNTNVILTATPDAGHSFSGWNGACTTVNGNTCTVAVNDQPTWVGAIFDKEQPPQLATTISVQFQVRKGGNGSGQVTASKIDCGSKCSAQFGYGRAITLTERPDSGSLFDGWNGVCARTQTTCVFAVGPITSIRASFTKDTTAPTAPGAVKVTGATRTTISLSWGPATDNVGVTGYRVYVDNKAVGDATSTSFTAPGLSCGTAYAVSVDAVDAVGNRSTRTSVQTTTKACALTRRVATVRVALGTSGARFVLVTPIGPTPMQVRLLLARGTRTVASGNYRIAKGKKVLRLPVSRAVPGGSYRLTMVVAAIGTKRNYTRMVVLPPAR